MSDAVIESSAHPPPDALALGAELRKEAYTMGLYVAICLLAALSAVPEGTGEGHAFEIVWGTTLGLAAAHWFAFQVSSRLVAAGTVRPNDAAAAGAQLAGAAVVALIATVPLLFFPTSVEYDIARLVLAGFIGFVGYAVARSGGSSRVWSLAYGTSVLVVALIVAVIKNVLVGH